MTISTYFDYYNGKDGYGSINILWKKSNGLNLAWEHYFYNTEKGDFGLFLKYNKNSTDFGVRFFDFPFDVSLSCAGDYKVLYKFKDTFIKQVYILGNAKNIGKYPVLGGKFVQQIGKIDLYSIIEYDLAVRKFSSLDLGFVTHISPLKFDISYDFPKEEISFCMDFDI